MKKNIIALYTIILIGAVTYQFDFASRIDTSTVDNLKASIIGETNASAKYLAYSKKAREEGFNSIALLFEAASKSEKIHANNHKSVLKQYGIVMEEVVPEYEVKTTKENLQDAMNGESYEISTMYPEFLKTANDSEMNLAMLSFNYAYQTEKRHKDLYKDALEKLESNNEDMLPSEYFICSTCGNTYAGEAPDRCGISMTSKDRYLIIN